MKSVPSILIFFLLAPVAILLAYRAVTNHLETGRERMAAELLSDLEAGDIPVEKVLARRELDVDEIEKVYGKKLADVVREVLAREADILEMAAETDSTKMTDNPMQPSGDREETESGDGGLGPLPVLEVSRLEPASGGLGPTPSLEGASLEPAGKGNQGTKP